MDFRPELSRPVTRRDAPGERREAALETLAGLPADLEGYTDGSVLQPRELRQGGGGYILLDARGPEPAIHRGLCAAGARCTSYRAELAALTKLLDDLIAGRGDDGREIAFPTELRRRAEVRVALDSQSLIVALAKGPSAQTGLAEMRAWERLIRLCRARHAHVTVQYVPGHVDLERQEEADVLAKEAARTCKQDATAISLGLVRAVLCATLRPELSGQIPEDHVWCRATGGKRPRHEGLPRAHQCLLSKLRAGRSEVTQDVAHMYGARTLEIAVPADGRHGLRLQNRVVTGLERGTPAEQAAVPLGCRVEGVNGREVGTDVELRAALREKRGRGARLRLRTVLDKKCPTGCGADDSTEHVLCKCPAYEAARHATFGDGAPPLTVLQTEPRRVVRYLQRIGRIGPSAAKVQGQTAPASAGGAAPRADATADAKRRPARANTERTSTNTNKPNPKPGCPLAGAHALPRR